jgi:hypothetical protein
LTLSSEEGLLVYSEAAEAADDHNYGDECNVGNWTDIVRVAAGYWHTVGLKDDRIVVAVGSNYYEECNVGSWTDIIQVTAGSHYTVGLKSDGTVVAVGGESPPDGVPEEGCFIASAAYGTPMGGEIEMLRQFRDEYLLTNPLGQALADFYYRASPPIAEFITEHPVLKPVVRTGLLPAVAMSAVVVNTTPAEKIAVIALLVLASVALTIWVTRRRDRGPEYTRG